MESMKFIVEEINKLKKNGYKLTVPRVRVLKILKKSSQPLTASEIFVRAGKSDLSSVYRALNLFEKLEVANAEEVNGEKIYCLSGNPHHHIICRKCGYVERFRCSNEFDVGQFKNFTDIKHRLVLVGTCWNCQD